ncbi:ABC transporter permease [Gluconacetobacter azotocaptans]|uniref:Autoinducer 2 import system permease protein LsrC n=1 Tax=Gluconacetobacter azotocaptans TaxID=142834 RepID=A0A7W4JSW0_9PROT|nr:ABC transporter permease [Gluconacetobacter azotocaptans]MBB2190268.1 ABC transporter permease [Gluconacetobacter azotocaptans]GBQ27339.1 monosaccharide ABC transporter permease [Gluconacetobacter azotocaptans DSM 13594]
MKSSALNLGPAAPALHGPRRVPVAWRALLARRETALLGVIVLVVTAVSLGAHGGFWTRVNLDGLMVTCAITAVPAAGMTLVILTGGIDASIGSMLGLVSAIGGLLFVAGWPVAAVVPVFLLAGAALGWINGLIILCGRVPPIVCTLGTLSIFRMGVFLMMGSEWITALPPGLTRFFVADHLGPLPGAAVIALVIMAALAAFLRVHRTGRRLFAIGNNEEAARLVGIPVRRLRWMTYTILGACVGLGALMRLGQSPIVQTTTGSGFELGVIAAVVLGGTELSGGRGGMFGTFLGTLVVGLVGDAIVLMHIQPFWSGVVLGSIILASVGLNEGRRARQVVS